MREMKNDRLGGKPWSRRARIPPPRFSLKSGPVIRGFLVQ